MTPEEQKIQNKINNDLAKAHEKLAELITELNSLSVVLQERVSNNKERALELRAEIDGLCDEFERVKSLGAQRITVLEERCDQTRARLAQLEQEVKELSALRTDSAILDTKLSSQAKTLAVIIGLGISVISTIVTLIINHLFAGG